MFFIETNNFDLKLRAFIGHRVIHFYGIFEIQIEKFYNKSKIIEIQQYLEGFLNNLLSYNQNFVIIYA